MADIGFIGLGLMGRPMAGHLAAAGHRLFVWGRRQVPPELLEKGAARCLCPREVAERAEFVFLIVSDTPDVEEVLFAPDGVAKGLTPGKVVIDMSTISPIATRSFAKRIEERGGHYLDAPVSGGDVGAKAATLTFMVGGEEPTFERVLPFFALMGKTITHVGGTGDGQTAKAANQIIVAVTIAAVAEALVFAAKAGADPAKVRQALLGGFAGSRVLEIHAERMLKRTFAPGFRLSLHHKDLAIALDGARKLGLALPHTALCQELFNASLAAGEGSLDDSALVRVIERLANYELG